MTDEAQGSGAANEQPGLGAASEQPPASGLFGSEGATVEQLRSNDEFLAALTNPMDHRHRSAQAAWDKAHTNEAASPDHAAEMLSDHMGATSEDAPETADGYQLSQVQLPGLEPDPDIAAVGREVAHGLGLSQAEFSTLETAWNGAIFGMGRGVAAPTMDDCAEALLQRHGQERAREMVLNANALIDKLPAQQRDSVRGMLGYSGLGNNHVFIEALAQMYERRNGGWA